MHLDPSRFGRQSAIDLMARASTGCQTERAEYNKQASTGLPREGTGVLDRIALMVVVVLVVAMFWCARMASSLPTSTLIFFSVMLPLPKQRKTAFDFLACSILAFVRGFNAR